MISPYRQNQAPSTKKLPRIRARLRGLYRRVILPFKVCAFIATSIGIGIGCAYLSLRAATDDASNYLHAWDCEVRRRQAVVDEAEKQSAARQAALDSKLHDIEFVTKTQFPLMVRGSFNQTPAEFHGLTLANANNPSVPIVCFLDRRDADVMMNCVRFDAQPKP